MSTSNWITIDSESVEATMTTKEKKEFGTAITDLDPTNRVCPIIDDVIAMVNSYVLGCERNLLPSDQTLIPASCKYHALAIIRYRLLTCLPNYEIGEHRTKEYEEAIKFLTDVASCKIGIIPPDGITIDSTSAIAKPYVYTDRCRRFTRSTQRGW